MFLINECLESFCFLGCFFMVFEKGVGCVKKVDWSVLFFGCDFDVY